MNKVGILLLFVFLLSPFLNFARTNQLASTKHCKIAMYSAKMNGVKHILRLENDTAFSLSIFPKKWLSCWQIIDYDGTYQLDNDTICFTFQRWVSSREYKKAKSEIIQEIFIVKRNKNIYRISNGGILFAKYRFAERLYRDIEM